MKIEAIILDRVDETFATKKGDKTLHILVCLDKSVPPLKNTFDYLMTADESAKFVNGWLGQTVTLMIRDIEQGFTKRLRLTGYMNAVPAVK